MDGDGSDVEPFLQRPAVERFDILQDVLKLVAAGFDAALRQAVEHKGIVGVGAVAESELQEDTSPGAREDACNSISLESGAFQAPGTLGVERVQGSGLR